jgi:hypothetical protein
MGIGAQGGRLCGISNNDEDSARDALIALWEASDRVCGKRHVAMVPALLPALERHGRLQPTSEARGLVGCGRLTE